MALEEAVSHTTADYADDSPTPDAETVRAFSGLMIGFALGTGFWALILFFIWLF